MEYLFSIIRNIGFKRTSEAFLFGAVLKDCANRGVDVDTVGTKLFEYMDEERIMDKMKMLDSPIEETQKRSPTLAEIYEK